jgi:hypothetical protein
MRLGQPVLPGARRVWKMTTRTALQITPWSLAGLAIFTAGLALEQHPKPTDYKGVTESVLAAIDPAKELDSVEKP